MPLVREFRVVSVSGLSAAVTACQLKTHIQYSKRTHRETGACGFRCRSVLEESNEEMGINKKKTFSLRPEFVTVKVWNYHFCPSPMRRHRMNSSNTTVPLATHLSSHHDGVGRFSGADDKGPSLPAVNDECSSGGIFFFDIVLQTSPTLTEFLTRRFPSEARPCSPRPRGIQSQRIPDNYDA